MKRLVLLAACLSVSCRVSPAAFAGGACDESGGCPEGLVCSLAQECVAPALAGNPGGENGNNNGTDGGGTTDGGGIIPAAFPCIGWSQPLHGFGTRVVCEDCSLSIDSGSGNAMLTTISDFDDNEAWALAALTKNPSVARGKLRGRLQLPPDPRLDDTSVFLRVMSGADSVLEVFFEKDFVPGVSSSAGMLTSASLRAVGTTRLLSSASRLFEITWARGGEVRLTVDGNTEVQRALAPFTGTDANVTEVRVGVQGLGGTGDRGWSVTLSEWILCDDPTGALP